MFRDILAFIRRHWPHLLLFIPGAIAVTILHEAAHAGAVLLQGGTVLQFVWLPGAGNWGYISYVFPDGTPHSTFLISIAPYLLWGSFATLASVLSVRKQKVGYGWASLIFFWLYVVPLGDIANTAFPYLAGKQNDFLSAFGHPSPAEAVIIGLSCAVAIFAGYHVQRGLYREDSLSVPSYVTLSTVVLIAMGALTV